MMCQDAHACEQLCKQLYNAPRFTYKLTNHNPDNYNDCDYGILLDSDLVKDAISSNSVIYGLKFSTVSTFFDLWSLGDKLSSVYPYKLIGAYYMNSS